MIILLIVLLVLLLGGGGGYYYGRGANWGASQVRRRALGLIVILLLVLWLTGNLAGGPV